jgi:hypothetical protein
LSAAGDQQGSGGFRGGYDRTVFTRNDKVMV